MALLISAALLIGRQAKVSYPGATGTQIKGKDGFSIFEVSASEAIWGNHRAVCLGVGPMGNMTYSQITLLDDRTIIQYNQRLLDFSGTDAIAYDNGLMSASSIQADARQIILKAIDILSLVPNAPPDALPRLRQSLNNLGSVWWQYKPRLKSSFYWYQKLTPWDKRDPGMIITEAGADAAKCFPVKLGEAVVSLERTRNGGQVMTVAGKGIELQILPAKTLADITAITDHRKLYLGTNNRSDYPVLSSRIDGSAQARLLQVVSLAESALTADDWPKCEWGKLLHNTLTDLADHRYYVRDQTVSYELERTIETQDDIPVLTYGLKSSTDDEILGGVTIKLTPDSVDIFDSFSMSLLYVNVDGVNLKQLKESAMQGYSLNIETIRGLAAVLSDEADRLPASLQPQAKKLYDTLLRANVFKAQLVENLAIPSWAVFLGLLNSQLAQPIRE